MRDGLKAVDSSPKNTTKFGKGNPGKPKGAVNKTTGELKTMILEALNGSGGVDYLMERAQDPKTASAFLTLVGKVLPLQVTGENGGSVQVTQVVRVILDK